MSWSDAKDVFLVGYGILLACLYGRKEPYFAYPATAAAFVIIWEAIGWNGLSSAVTILVVFLAFVIAVALRAVRHLPLLQLEPVNAVDSFKIMIAGFAVWLFVVLIVTPFLG